jgi:hypothetical protein
MGISFDTLSFAFIAACGAVLSLIQWYVDVPLQYFAYKVSRIPFRVRMVMGPDDGPGVFVILVTTRHVHVSVAAWGGASNVASAVMVSSVEDPDPDPAAKTAVG